MSTSIRLIAAAIGCTALTLPVLAQQSERPSRACMQEIRALCGSDRSQMRTCLRERYTELSDTCQTALRDRMQQRAGRQGNSEGLRPYQRTMRPKMTVVYGGHQRQGVDVFEPQGVVEPLPLVLFIHGGGWSMGDRAQSVQAKPVHFTDNGYYFASTGYRLLPDTPVEEQATDVGAAIQALVGQASAVGFDPERIVLMGHSAGAHLAALVATDPKYAGEAFGTIKGVVLLDGAGYDVAANMAQAGPQGWQIYNAAFGSDPARQAALSPVTHVGGPDAPNWLALYVEERDIARDQAEVLVSGLVTNGADAKAVAISGTDHGRMNRELGTDAGAQQTAEVDAFLARVFAD